MDHLTHGELADFAADRPRDIGHLDDAPRHVVRARMLPDAEANPFLQAGIEPVLRAEPHEEHDPDVAVPLLPDHHAFDNLRELLDLPVDLRRPDPNSARIERGVAPAQNDQAVVAREPGPVTVAPHAGKVLEVRAAILGAVGIVPERYRHAGKRPGAD